ncbi:hypothetical protein RM549_03115 [Salegentibacter sp. F188]|uniref:NADH dehydrogenase subunit 6 n=1 Tax=Autumnicola patrickiae TaxID=3075591 RepID=A0ABU3DYG0_9FLAO|nr:hypothetical protein [Salegentibacter sp. F188]MDT0688756.1 hypothetical protein [Salegentibacter sp. F188]
MKIGLFLFLILSLTSCAPAGPTESEYGFFGGLWHGFIITFSLIGYLIFEIGIFAETNTGFTYYLGCGIGMLIMSIISLGKL